MDSTLKKMIEEYVVKTLKTTYEQDGLTDTTDLLFHDFDWDFWEYIKGIVPADDEEAYGRIFAEAETTAKNKFNFVMERLTAACHIVGEALKC